MKNLKKTITKNIKETVRNIFRNGTDYQIYYRFNTENAGDVSVLEITDNSDENKCIYRIENNHSNNTLFKMTPISISMTCMEVENINRLSNLLRWIDGIMNTMYEEKFNKKLVFNTNNNPPNEKFHYKIEFDFDINKYNEKLFKKFSKER